MDVDRVLTHPDVVRAADGATSNLTGRERKIVEAAARVTLQQIDVVSGSPISQVRTENKSPQPLSSAQATL